MLSLQNRRGHRSHGATSFISAGMAELLPQRPGSRRTAAGTAAVAILRKKFDVLDKELAAASAAVAAQPNDPGALQHRAELYVARGRKQEALQDLRSAVALDGRASPVDTVSAEWRRVCQWVVWRAYVTLVVVLGAIIVISGLLAVLSDLRGLSPTPLYSAVDRGDLAKVEGLLRAGHSPGSAAVLGVPMGSQLLMQTPLSVAVTQNYPEMVQALLVAGAEPNSGKAEGPLGWISTETPLYSVRVGRCRWPSKAPASTKRGLAKLSPNVYAHLWRSCRRPSWGTPLLSGSC